MHILIVYFNFTGTCRCLDT